PPSVSDAARSPALHLRWLWVETSDGAGSNREPQAGGCSRLASDKGHKGDGSRESIGTREVDRIHGPGAVLAADLLRAGQAFAIDGDDHEPGPIAPERLDQRGRH